MAAGGIEEQLKDKRAKGKRTQLILLLFNCLIFAFDGYVLIYGM